VAQLPAPCSWWRLLGLFSVALAALGLLVAPATAQVSSSKIEPAVASALQAYGSTDFFVEFAERADLTAASAIADWNRRGAAVVTALQQTANASQAAARQRLDAAKVAYQSFWVGNTILVRSGTQAVADDLARMPNVQRITAPKTYQIPKPIVGTPEPTFNAVEWGVSRIKADQVWSTFGVRGEGIVVANIDTGVQYNHPAVVNQYRGNNGGSFDHNYNWYDPSSVCGSPSLVPCDNNNHGTHTMGTMVGDDGGTNQIGVAPAARWIAAKGCESGSCSNAALLSSGQWVLAPTRLDGTGADPSKRPHIVNNSWAGGGGDTWYLNTVNAWRAAGIFPAFSNGNSGPSCSSSRSPGDYAESYSSGAFDINNVIASFSSRGPAAAGIKPNLASPGVNVRSSINGGGYSAFSGTSMASPHTAGAVALMWSAAASLVGDIAQTSALLNQTAIDTSDLTCGGTAANNNVWGEGKLDALASVTQSPRGPTGTLAGTVTNASNGAAIAGATVTITGPVNRTVTTNAAGSYTVTLPVGSYAVTASAFGFASGNANVSITSGVTTTQNFALAPPPGWSGWESLGGELTSGPGVSSWAAGRLDVFVRGGDNALYHRSYEGNWSGWQGLGGELTSDPVAVSWGPGRIDVFARGTDHSLIHKWFDGGWSAWESLGGELTSGPGVSSWAAGRLDVFVRGGDNALYHRSYEGNWSGWQGLGGELTSDPVAVSWGPGRIDVFVRGGDAALWHKWLG